MWFISDKKIIIIIIIVVQQANWGFLSTNCIKSIIKWVTILSKKIKCFRLTPPVSSLHWFAASPTFLGKTCLFLSFATVSESKSQWTHEGSLSVKKHIFIAVTTQSIWLKCLYRRHTLFSGKNIIYLEFVPMDCLPFNTQYSQCSAAID